VNRRQTVAVAISSILAFSLIVASRPAAVRATGDTIYVGFGASGDNTGCSDPDYGVATLGAKHAIGGALRAAADGDTVHLCAGTYDLTTGIRIGAWMANDITIRGAGASTTTLNGGGDTQILRMWGYDTDLKIMDVTFYDGFDSNDGGAICHDDGRLTLTRTVFLENVSAGYGGAIACSGRSLTVLNSQFIGNVADDHGGAIDVHQSDGTIIRNSRFVNNHSDSQGGALGANGSDLDVQGSVFTGNTADQDGGAIWYPRSSGLLMKGNTFRSNSSDSVGGAIALLDTREMKQVGRKLLITNRFLGNRAVPSRTAKVGFIVGGCC
jgi:predicted outer membrane repeat protein